METFIKTDCESFEARTVELGVGRYASQPSSATSSESRCSGLLKALLVTHGLSWGRSQASALRDRQLTACAATRLTCHNMCMH